MFAFLSGYKTYIAAVGMILVGFAGWLSGEQSLIALITGEHVQLILEGVGLGGIRAAMEKLLK